MSRKSILIGLTCFVHLTAQALPSALFRRLDENSLQQTLAFYELFSDTDEGKSALKMAAQKLGAEDWNQIIPLVPYINTLGSIQFSDEALAVIDRLANQAKLPNRSLKGYKARSEKEVLALPFSEVDLGKALLLSQLDGKEECEKQVQHYSALLDLMALQILAILPPQATPEQKIEAINYLIFDQMHFRFPPHSVYVKDIDLYTFLPSVMDNHLGVCLGVTAMYLALSQRLDLPLDILTPPGHIYISYRKGESVRNIETTARGIHVPSDTYLNVNTMKISERNIKEVVGLTQVNQASIYLQKGDFEKARSTYEKALLYLPEDHLVKELLGCCLVITGEKERGSKFLQDVVKTKAEGVIASSRLPEDYLAGKVDEEGLRAIFIGVDENRSSIESKIEQLNQVLAKYPDFRDGLHQMAVCWLQLQRAKEGLKYLERYHALDAEHPTMEYYLAVLYGEREDFAKCWEHFHLAEALVKKEGFSPKALRDLRRELIMICPE